MPNHGGFVSVNNYLAKNMSSFDGITFYPVIRYKGMRVWPLAWHRESTEPLLKVHSAWGSKDYPPGDERAFDDMLKSEGWVYDREGGEGYVHVDDLEKIEGPPPEGAF